MNFMRFLNSHYRPLNVLITPLQMNGEMLKPRLIKEVTKSGIRTTSEI